MGEQGWVDGQAHVGDITANIKMGDDKWELPTLHLVAIN